MTNKSETAWGLIPARGGSKSISNKNLLKLGGHTLIAIAAGVARHSGMMEKIVCSSDAESHLKEALRCGVQADRRPYHLAQDDSAVLDVVVEFLERQQKQGVILPEYLVLLQPTSPFLQARTIRSGLSLMKGNPDALSYQSISVLPHNHHAYNQRFFEGGCVRFRFHQERMECFNKQLKPKFYIFGNLIITRVQALMSGKGIFAEPSLGEVIPSREAFDIDSAEDVDFAQWLVQTEKVRLDL